MSQINENNEKKIKEANDLKSKIEGREVKIQMEANEDGNLYGNVNVKQIYDQLNDLYSLDVNPANIIIGNIKELGSHTATLRLSDEISATIKVEVLKKA